MRRQKNLRDEFPHLTIKKKITTKIPAKATKAKINNSFGKFRPTFVELLANIVDLRDLLISNKKSIPLPHHARQFCRSFHCRAREKLHSEMLLSRLSGVRLMAELY